ncbi:Ribonuclease HII [bioreactor metagenome]|uniref:Ribonuclease HII n=1 Tax=bioreactor metagenome TaxID=1076179 RepID=A0A645GVC4_9ZZZZ
MVAVAVAFPRGAQIPRVNDSKQLRAAEREALDRAIRAVVGVRIGLAELPVETIDELNILRATHLAMRRAAEQIPEADCLLVDGLPVPGLPKPSFAFVSGDARSASIAAASIVAKVYRDRRMDEYDALYPGYGFAEHKGYGTRAHMAALARLGVTPIHRRSFTPVREILDPPPEQLTLF